MSAESIIHVLEKLQALHGSLLDLAARKTEFIKNGDMDSLEGLLKDEQAHVAAISQLERQRMAVAAQFMAQRGWHVPEPTVTEIAETAGGAEGEALLTIRDQLLATVDELKARNALNQRLTFQSLQYVNMSLDLLQPKRGPINYTKTDAAGARKRVTRSFFDSQA
ncbi:flagellar protein FlgN [Indiicoccus explosivorum]|uniref:flagellar protein FlgN n=1 Tax=Indiicoccus explosivorum TaxID=1917864 RepID=UPI000B431C8B|nr:flagellar protein FlgN [Indiicoccus explosivorum]